MAKPLDNPTPNGFKKDGTPNNPTGKGGFRDNPQNKANGRWKAENSASYQYNRWNNMDSELALMYAKAWKIVPMDEKEASQPEMVEFVELHKKHTLVEERTLRAYFRSMTSLADAREMDNRTEGMPIATVRATVKNDFEGMSIADQQKLAMALTPIAKAEDEEDSTDGDGDASQSEAITN